jgi:Tfp pilus assembly protein PilP
MGEPLVPKGVPSPVKHVSEYDLELAGERSDLEKVSTDALQFKGTMSQEGVPVALVWANRQLHLVHLGDYLGPHHGKVVQITARELRIRELLQDASGQLKPRATVLAVNEGSK